MKPQNCETPIIDSDSLSLKIFDQNLFNNHHFFKRPFSNEKNGHPKFSGTDYKLLIFLSGILYFEKVTISFKLDGRFSGPRNENL